MRRAPPSTRFEHVGYAVVHGVADWVFAPKDREIQLEMLAGWAAAAREIGGVAPTDVIAWLTRRRGFVTAGRSTIRVGHVDFFAQPHRHALSRQIAVEQHVVVEPVHPHRRQDRLVDAGDRRQREAGPSRAENDRRDQEMKPVEASGGEEPGDGVGAAFDQHPAQAPFGERRENGRRRDMPVGAGEADDLDVGRQRRPGAGAGDHQAAHAIGGEEPCAGGKPAPRIDHDPRRLRPGHPPDRELRIVGERRPNPDDHRIDQGAQPVQMGQGRPAR